MVKPMDADATAVAASKVGLIPAYEPTAALVDLVPDLVSAGFLVVLVDDGSSPKCQPLFDQVADQAILLRHAVNQGKGEALKTGLSWIAEHVDGDPVVITVDADGQHLTKDVLAVCQAAAEGDGLYLGSRSDGGETPQVRGFAHRISRAGFRFVTGVSVKDTQTGLRAFRASLIPTLLAIPGKRYEYEMNQLLACARQGIAIVEVPITTVYIGANESSHYRPLMDSVIIGRDLLRFASSSFVSFLIDYALFIGLLALGNRLGLAWAMIGANIIARGVSGAINYQINRRLVFRQPGRFVATFSGYVVLSVGIVLANTAVLTALTSLTGLNPWIAKLIVEACFFIVSWTVQRHIIFRRRSAKPQPKGQ